jgi:hypothetical protein
VTVIPDVCRIDVFNSGICIGLNGEIPVGSHAHPRLIVGESLLWNNAQKTAISTLEAPLLRLAQGCIAFG